jgi:hypothetical protein
VQADETRELSNPPSNVLPLRQRPPQVDLPKPSPERRQGGSPGELAISRSHVRRFAEECLRAVDGTSVAASDILAAYHVWCAARAHAPLSMPRLAAELREFGYVKWKSHGLVRYRDQCPDEYCTGNAAQAWRRLSKGSHSVVLAFGMSGTHMIGV